MSPKQRLSASVDADLIAAGQAAVADGRADTLSSWVSDALRHQVEHERRLAALGEVIASFEAEHGELSEAEIAEAGRWARERSVVVRNAAPSRERAPAA